MSKAWSNGSTRAWRRTRARVLARDGYRCQLQRPGCTTIADQVHHTLGKGVSERDEDLQAACAHCNSSLGDPRSSDLTPRPTTRW